MFKTIKCLFTVWFCLNMVLRVGAEGKETKPESKDPEAIEKSNVKKPAVSKPVNYYEIEIDEDKIKRLIKDTISDLKKKFKDDKLAVTEIMIYSTNLTFWVKHPYLEVDTGITKKWYEKILLAIDNLVKLKDFMDNAQLKKDQAGFDHAKANFQKVLDILTEFVKKPEKISEDRMKKLKEWKDEMELKRLEAEKLQKQKEKAARATEKKKAKKKKAEDEEEEE